MLGFLGVTFASLSLGRRELAKVGLLDSVWVEGVCGYCLNRKVYFLKSFVSLESEKMKERMKKRRLYLEEKMKNEEMRRIERKKRESKKKRVVRCKLA